jgi:argonaute-like protein implicated in RNA metabolism and viral defense
MMNATITEEHFNKYSEEAQMFFGKRKEKKTVSPVHLEDKYRKRRKRTTNSGERSEFDQMRFDKIMRIFRQKASIDATSCKSSAPSLLNELVILFSFLFFFQRTFVLLLNIY